MPLMDAINGRIYIPKTYVLRHFLSSHKVPFEGVSTGLSFLFHWLDILDKVLDRSLPLAQQASRSSTSRH